ncbi:MAG: hypothetical protein P8X89_22300, partial [Reinekea sp.]
TGQTSGGRAASGASWNQPTPGQPQPYQNFNFPEHIPPLHGSDWEYSQQFPQSNASENTIGSQVLLSPPNAQPAVHNFNFPEYIPPLHGSDWEYSQQSPQSNASENTIGSNAQPAVQNFNFPEYIPSLHGADWEYSQQSPQLNASENTIGSEVPLSPSDIQPAFQNFSFPEYIPPLHGADREYSQQSPQSSASGNSIESEEPLSPSNAQSTAQNFNFPEYIPPLHGSDWEYSQQSPQPMVLDDIVQNDAPLAPSNPQPAAAPRRHKSPTRRVPPAKERFLAGLEAFAQGVDLKDCSSSLKFGNYIRCDGTLTPRMGRNLYNQLTDGEKDLLSAAVNARQEFVKAPVEERFLASLDDYARGVPVERCSATISLRSYIGDDGFLQKKGKALLNRLSEKDQERVHEALLSRRQGHLNRVMNTASVEERFLAGLENYAEGLSLVKCSASLRYPKYVSDDGKLSEPGRELISRLSEEDQNRVNEALATRRRRAAEHISGDLPYFLAALEPYGNGLEFQQCANQSGLTSTQAKYQRVERYLTLEGGLTAKGQLLIENLPPDERSYVLEKVEQRRQHINPSAQMPESLWQLPEIPASMPEMGGMDPTAMVDPMQTETMMVAAWQYTGQAMPGIWGMPSEPVEPPIPSYNNEAFGADFQHQYGSYADQYPGRGV